MRKVYLFLTLSFLFFLTTAHAEVPKLLHYQGHLVDGQGMPLQGAHQLTFRVYRQDAGGSVLWSQVFPQARMEDGNFAVLLDVGTDPSLTFNESYWLSIAVDADSEMTPRQQIASSAYSINAQTVNGIPASATAAANTILPLNAQAKFPQSVLDIQEGQGGEFDADTVDGFHASAAKTPNTLLPLDASALVPLNAIPQGPASGLDADKVDGKEASQLLDRTQHTGVQPPSTISPQGAGSGLNADKVDGFDAGHSSGQIPISDGQLNANLNADLVGGFHASDLLFFNNVQAFTSNGTWIKPPNVNRVYVKVWGCGGQGYGYTSSNAFGGGGGGYSEGWIAVFGDVTVTVAPGNSQGISSFAGNTIIQATCGSGGVYGGGGGVGLGGSINLSGAGSGLGGSYVGGSGGGSPFGGAGGGGTGAGSAGSGCIPGGGGGGSTGGIIGSGATGLVIVYY